MHFMHIGGYTLCLTVVYCSVWLRKARPHRKSQRVGQSRALEPVLASSPKGRLKQNLFWLLPLISHNTPPFPLSSTFWFPSVPPCLISPSAPLPLPYAPPLLPLREIFFKDCVEWMPTE